MFLLGLVGFVLSTFQLYYAKFRRLGVVRSGFYKHIRHPQYLVLEYLFLAFAGFGLLIVWPRFILLIVYIHVVWFHYLLARSEERRMETQYGEAYREEQRRTWMFLPGEPGRFLNQHLFGWIRHNKVRRTVIYTLSLALAIGAAFVLRRASLALIAHASCRSRRLQQYRFYP